MVPFSRERFVLIETEPGITVANFFKMASPWHLLLLRITIKDFCADERNAFHSK